MASAFVIILVILFGSFYSITSETFQISKDNLDKALVGHLLLEINGQNLHECARNCMSFALCKSFNYDLRERLCKLNDVESSAVNLSEIIAKKGSIFSDIKEWPSTMVHKCSSRQCQDNQRCLVNGGSFVCRDITCAIDQQIDHGHVEVFAPTENKFRSKALLKCDIGYTPIQQELECQASGEWQPAICQKLSDCKEILDTFPQAKSGLYEIELWNSKEMLTVNCDMETEGGGWTIFHRRMNGSVGFYRNFTEYENGFGNADGELWLGLKPVQELADQGATDLRLDMTKDNDDTGQETFGEFMLTEGAKYKLNIGSRYTGDGSLARGLFYNNGMPFSTFDRDIDNGPRNCAVERHGAWWYNQCSYVNLNGLYVTPACAIDQQIDHGHVEVFAPTENKFRSKALLKCDIGYTPIQQELECQASGEWQPAICQKLSDCKEILDTFPQAKSGLYEIELWNSKEMLTVNCDMETEGGGWTIFHRRMNGSVGFYRNFTEYENGFGNADGELWLGLKPVQELADQGATDLRLDMTKDSDDTGQETFGEFMLTEGANYKLNIGSRYTGDGSLARGLFYNNGMPFSTFDRDIDNGPRNCAVERHGAWWYNQCSYVNLNGLYVTPGTLCTFPGAQYRICGHVHEGYNGLQALKKSSMMLRRK